MVVICARMFPIKNVFVMMVGVFSFTVSIHDNFGDEDRDLKGYFTVKK